MSEDPIAIWALVRETFVAGGLAIFIWSLYKGHIVFGKDCDEDKNLLKEQRDQYKIIADKAHSDMERKLRLLEDLEFGRKDRGEG